MGQREEFDELELNPNSGNSNEQRYNEFERRFVGEIESRRLRGLSANTAFSKVSVAKIES